MNFDRWDRLFQSISLKNWSYKYKEHNCKKWKKNPRITSIKLAYHKPMRTFSISSANKPIYGCGNHPKTTIIMLIHTHKYTITKLHINSSIQTNQSRDQIENPNLDQSLHTKPTWLFITYRSIGNKITCKNDQSPDPSFNTTHQWSNHQKH